MTKTCSKCGSEKDLSQFDKNKCSKDGYNNWCKTCKRNYHYARKGLVPPEIKIPKQGFKFCQKCGLEKSLNEFCDNGKYAYCYDCNKLYYQENKEKLTNYFDIYNKSDRHKEAVRKYRRNNKERELRMQRERYQNNIDMRLNRSISGGIWSCIKINKNYRHWEILVNYTFEELKEHLEKQFKPGMTWDNYGEWHIDHIIPKKSLKYNSEKDDNFKVVWGLANLRPLWANENRCRPEDGSDVPEELKQYIIRTNLERSDNIDKNAISKAIESPCNLSCRSK